MKSGHILIRFFFYCVIMYNLSGSVVVAATKWSQTTPSEFETCILSQVDVATEPGGVQLNPPDNNTVLLLHFDEGSGTTTSDSSGNNRDATLGSTTAGDSAEPAWSTSGKIGNCLQLDGIDDYVRIDYDFPDSSVTVEAWFKLSVNQDAVLFDKGFGNLSFGYNAPSRLVTFRVYAGGSDQGVVGVTPLSVNTWYHIAGVVDDSAKTVKLYINGVLDKSGSYSGALDFGDNQVTLGSYYWGHSVFFSGFIDEFRISNEPVPPNLNKSEVSAKL